MDNVLQQSVTFVEGVILRPYMYTLNSTLLEVIAFLEGYYSGMAKGNPYAPAVVEWQAFKQSLSEQLGVAISQVFPTFANLHQDNQTALQALSASFVRFQNEQQTVNPR